MSADRVDSTTFVLPWLHTRTISLVFKEKESWSLFGFSQQLKMRRTFIFGKNSNKSSAETDSHAGCTYGSSNNQIMMRIRKWRLYFPSALSPYFVLLKDSYWTNVLSFYLISLSVWTGYPSIMKLIAGMVGIWMRMNILLNTTHYNNRLIFGKFITRNKWEDINLFSY